MKLIVEGILLSTLIFFSLSVVNAQEESVLPPPPPVENEDNEGCGLTYSDLVQLNVSVWSNKQGYLNDLTYKDFEVYEEKEPQEIVSFKFNELKNQYTIGLYQKDFILDYKWRDVKVKVKLSEEKKKHYGEIFVQAQNGYYPNQN